MDKMGKGKGFSFNQMIVVILVVVGIVVGTIYFTGQPQSATGNVVSEPTSGATVADCEAQQCFQVPAYTYSAVDTFDSAAVSGTARIKVDGKAPVTSLASPQKCSELTYWLESTTHFVEPVVVDQVACGANQVQAKGIENGSVTITAYDQFTALTNGGGVNFTLGANGIKNIDYVWEGEAEKGNMPLGGCLCVEYPSTLSYAKPSGAGLSDSTCAFKKTYTVSSTGNAYQCYNVPAGWDADGTGEKKSFSIQLKAGSTNPSGSVITTFYPAAYYVTDDGNFALGVEKDQNDDTTATFSSANTFTAVME